MNIDLNAWEERLEEMVGEILPVDTRVSADPMRFFEGFFDGEPGYPLSEDIYPIWGDKGLVICIETAEAFAFSLDDGQWRKTEDKPYTRVFWISESGTLGEVDDYSGRVHDFFPISSPNAAAEYVALLCGKQLERSYRKKAREMRPEDLITDTYIHFFRYPDDLSPRVRDMPWVSTRSLVQLLNQHVEASIEWLGAITTWFKLDALRRKIKDQSESAKTIRLSDSGEQISPAEFALRLSEELGQDTHSQWGAYMAAASGLKDSDILDDKDRWRLMLYGFGYGDRGPWENIGLDVGVLLEQSVFPDFLSEGVNPGAWRSIRRQVGYTLLGHTKDDSSTPIAVPSPTEQRKLAFEALAYRETESLSVL